MNTGRPIVSLVWAMSENRVIGVKNRLPWHLPADLRHFKKLTLGKPILMGRKTWESLPGLLPEREHIVLTRDKNYTADGCTVVHSFENALARSTDVSEIMVVGGTALYELALPQADRLYLTLVHATLEGDAFFPIFDQSQWRETDRRYHPADDKNVYAMSFISLERNTPKSEAD
jgi:dihydrofolate reductase